MAEQPVTPNQRFSFKGFWKKTSGKVVVVSGFIAAVTTILTSMGSVWGLFKSAKNKGVQVVDIRIGPNDTIDVKLRNTGSEVAYIKAARLNIKKAWKIVPDTTSSFMKVEPTETYQVNIDSKKEAPYTIEIPVSQGIKPNDFDRFQLSLYHKQANDDNNAYVYLTDLELVMDENNTVIKKPNILFAFMLPMQHYQKLRPENIRSVEEIRAVNGYKSETLNELLSKDAFKILL